MRDIKGERRQREQIFLCNKNIYSSRQTKLKRAHKNGQDKHLDFASGDLFFIYLYSFTFFRSSLTQ